MKKLYALFLLVFCSLIGHAQIVIFEDPNFEEYLLTEPTVDSNNDQIPDAYVDTDSDGAIEITEAEAISNLYIYSNFTITDLTGIEAFSNLRLLKSYVAISASNLNSLANLEALDLSYSHAGGAITVAGLLHLKTINFSNASYDALTLTGLPSLETLVCSNDNLTTLNCSGLSSLKDLDCSYNQLTSLIITGLTSLTDLDCGHNQLASLNLSDTTNLEYLNINYFQSSSIDLSHLIHLKQLDCWHSSLTSLDLSQLADLETLNCPYSTHITALNISNLPSLKYLYCSYSTIESIATNGSHNLEEILCENNSITALDVNDMPNLSLLWCTNNQINSLNVTTDTNLTDLRCSNNLIPNLNLTNLAQLTNLECHHNLITNLDTSNLANLTNLDCNDNVMTTLNTNTLINLVDLNCSNNPLNSIDLTNLVHLKNLTCSNNNLTSLSISHLNDLRNLDCSNNQLTVLELPTVSYFYSNHGSTAHINIDCSENLFSTLDFSTISCNRVDVSLADNPNLTYVSLKNERTHFEVESLDNCPTLHYICINPYNESQWSAFGGVFENIDSDLLTNIQINSYCSFIPGGVYNTITGILSLDSDNTGCDANDFHFSDSKMVITGISSQFNATYTNTNGSYNFYTQEGNFVITPKFENPYFTVSPASATINFTDSNSTIQTQNFCVVPNGVHNDLEITLLPIRTAKPGFDATYQLVYKNKGNQTLSGNINLTFNDAVLDFVAANPALSDQSLNTLRWTYSNLIPFESRTINFTLNVNAPQEVPAVNSGDVLQFSTTIDPVSGDETSADNTFTLAQTVSGAYDPNDKTCLEGSTIAIEKVGDYLHYMIRFQNSGTETAANVVVKDIIDTTKFDSTSLEFLSSSHPQVTKITGSKVEFQFQNINLPAASDDEPGSHGFIAFKIKTKSNLVIGNTVANKANIYFDYNFPIETNTATSTIAALGVNAFENSLVSATPNPVKNKLHLTSKINITSVQLFDVQGRILETRFFSATTIDFDLSRQPTGVYFVKIQTEQGVKIEKIIKE